ncbi:tyrosine--tRNA ligase [Candidatus Marinimicrobia bacterium]|nr:tyrosine--tRNA ligase [Candidatus Neomarinimicrobiota bacterium]
MKFPDLNTQMDLIKKGTEEILPEHSLEIKIRKSLKMKQPLEVKCGCDPSRPDLHLGHSVILRKMRDFQDLGHNVTLLIGDFTAMIGDPTGKNKTRPQLTIKDTKDNAKTYIDQANKILDSKSIIVKNNSKWLEMMNFKDIISLASKYTVARMLERDDFTKRYKAGSPIALHEFLYPLAQGYDSVVMKTDIELGGTDQKFNLLVGRDLQRDSGLDQQVIITTPIIEGLDGKEKMSKSNDNYIGFTDSADEMFGKVLSIPDELILKYYEFCSGSSVNELLVFKEKFKDSNPRDMKRELACKIIETFHSKDDSLNAMENFDRVFIKKSIPDDIPVYSMKNPERLLHVLTKNNLVVSNGEAKRLIKQGAVKVGDIKISDINFTLDLKEQVIKCGKRKFLKVIL